MPEELLAAQDASVVFGSGAIASRGLDCVSLSFEPGEVTLLMGASGSGKTTLLSILGCLRNPDIGHVTVMGKKLKNCPERDLIAIRGKHIGFVFQFYRLFRALSAAENVALGVELAGGRGAAAQSIQALDAVGLAAKRHLKPDQMSGGERQRVAIARALVKNPSILLADEPTAALDSASGWQIAELIRNCVKERQMVAVLATHDPRLLPAGDRIVEMRDGRIVNDHRTTT